VNRFRGHPSGDEERRAKIPLYRPWEELSDREKDEMDLEMAVYAAMIDNMDQNIGRVLKKLTMKGCLIIP
jgi:arylsulfatase A-like enzyme